MPSGRSTPSRTEPPADAAGQTTLHATCVAIDGHAIVVTGDAGAGKSSLALQLIDGGAILVADDVTTLYRDDDRLIAKAPAHYAGLIEARGNGLLTLPHTDEAPVALFVALKPAAATPNLEERLPEPATRSELGVAVPLIELDPTHPVSASIVRLAVAHGAPHIPTVQADPS